MKTLKRITGTENELTNFVAVIGIMTVALLVCSFTILALQNGIKTF